MKSFFPVFVEGFWRNLRLDRGDSVSLRFFASRHQGTGLLLRGEKEKKGKDISLREACSDLARHLCNWS